jgi:hypothetical protein
MINVNAPRARALRNIAMFPPVKILILNNDRSNIGLGTLFSINVKNTSIDIPVAIDKKVRNRLIVLKEPKVTPSRIRNNPPANVAFPSQSIFSFPIVPNSFILAWDQIVANIPMGRLIQKIDLHPK